MGLHTKHIFLSSTIREFAGKHNAICIKISFSRRWMGRGWVDRKAGLLRCRLALGEAPGLRRGRRRLAAEGRPCGPPLGLPNKRARPGPKAPGSLFQGASRPAAAPPGTLEFPPALRSIHHPFPPRLPANKTSGPLPMSGPPAYSAGNPEKFSSRFSPAFFKSGPGVWGRSPQRGPGAAPLTGSRGSAPAAVPRHATRNRRQAFWKVASSSSAREHWWSSASFWAMRGRKVESLRWPRWGTGVM